MELNHLLPQECGRLNNITNDAMKDQLTIDNSNEKN